MIKKIPNGIFFNVFGRVEIVVKQIFEKKMYFCKKIKFESMSSYVIKVNEKIMQGKTLLSYLKSLSKTSDYLYIMPHKEEPKNGLDEAIEDLKMGRVTKYKNVEEYKKGMREKFGYV